MTGQPLENRTDIPLLDLGREYRALAAEIEPALQKACANAAYILGPEVEKFEKKAASYLGLEHCLGVASGTDALLIALRALAIRRKGCEYFSPSDQIITTPFTFTATGGAILRAGATPVFVDIEAATFNLDPRQVEAAVTPATVGIIPVHLYGQTCAMDAIMQVAREHSLFVLEDAAQSFGAEWRGKKAGTLGDVAAFSFFPSKNLGCFGDGGMIATGDDKLAETALMLRTHGGRDKYDALHCGYNSRLDALQAAVLQVKLRHIDRFNRRRREVAARYREGLGELAWLTLPVEAEHAGHVYHQYTLRVPKENREKIRAALKHRGIASAVYYPVPLDQMALFRDKSLTSGDLGQSERAAGEVLSLPMGPLLVDEEIARVVETLRKLPQIYDEGDDFK